MSSFQQPLRYNAIMVTVSTSGRMSISLLRSRFVLKPNQQDRKFADENLNFPSEGHMRIAPYLAWPLSLPANNGMHASISAL